MKESDIQRQILDYLAYKHYTCYRSNNTGIWNAQRQAYIFHGTKGVPDIVCIIPPSGKYLGIECKSGTGKLSPHQKEFRKKVEAGGGAYIVARSLDDVIQYIV